MKKYVCFLAIIFPSLLFSQVAINTDGSLADTSAILDIKSSTKGLLMPRLTTAARTAIASPAIGLTVFDSDTYSYWMYRGDVMGGWTEMQHGYQNFWASSGSNAFNTNNGNVGIGTNSPGEKFSINGTNPALQFMNGGTPKGFLQSNSNDLKLSTYFNNTTGKLIFGTRGYDHFNIDESGRVSIGTTSNYDALLKLNGLNPKLSFLSGDVHKGFIRLQNNDFNLGTASGNPSNIVFTSAGVDRVWIDENGKMGIGTASPSSLLTINGSNPYIQMQNSSVDKGFLLVNGSDLRVGTNSTNTTGNLVFQTKLNDRMTIDENGNVGIGTSTPTSILSINSSNPIVQLKNSGTDKGFVQLVGDDIKIGTNSGNALGKFIIRTAGSDRMNIDQAGYMILGNGTNGGLAINSEIPLITIQKSGLTKALIGVEENSENVIIQKSAWSGGKLILNGYNGVGSSLHLSNGHMNFGNGLIPNGYKLSVEGKVIATDFVSQAVNNWPDYVFEKDYKLMPLEEVKNYINTNKHLPNIPSATEMEKNGIALADISKRLMEKVEELTLYILELKGEIDILKKTKQ